MKERDWQWFVMGFMYRGESRDTQASSEARKKFNELYDSWVSDVIENPLDDMIELCNRDNERYGIERD